MWVFNWWTRGDVLGWANADPCVDRIHVRVDVVAPDLGEKHPHGEQDDDNEPMCSIVLARVSTFPWTPTLRGIQTAEDAVDVMDSHGSSILASAETWLETAASHIRGDLIAPGTLVMIPRNSRCSVFLVQATRMESPAGVDYVEATRALASVVADEHCVLSLAPPLACCPTYFHASWQGRTFAAFEEQSDTLLSIIRSSFNHRKQLQTLNIRPIRALYVAGPAGSGKEFLIMHTIAARARMPVVYIHISEELDAIRKNAQSTRPGLTPLKKAVWKAILCAPSVLLVDGMSLLALEPKFADVDALDAASHVAGLLSMAPRATVCIVAPVVDPTKLPDVLRPGVDEARLFSRVVELPIPSAMQRESLCRACFGMLAAASHPFMRGGSGSVAAVARGGEAMPGMSVAGALLPDEIESLSRHIAQRTPGYVARDLFMVITRAVHACASAAQSRPQPQKPDLAVSSSAMDDALGALTATLQGLSLGTAGRESAAATPAEPSAAKMVRESVDKWLRAIPPSQASAVGFDTTKRHVAWSSIGGYDEVKKAVFRLVLWPVMHPEAYRRLGVRPPMGVLLHGPSGCGKTMIVHAVASLANMNFMAVKSNDIFSKYLGESEANIRALFAAARQLAPCIVFLDEIDAIAMRREWTEDGAGGVNERVLSTLLNEMDGVQERTGVVVVACTSRIDKLDDALLRPGRLDSHVLVGLPGRADRLQILGTLPLAMSDEEMGEIADRTEGFTGADLHALAREAGMCALRESMAAAEIAKRHVDAAMAGALRSLGGGDSGGDAAWSDTDDDASGSGGDSDSAAAGDSGGGSGDLLPTGGPRGWWLPGAAGRE